MVADAEEHGRRLDNRLGYCYGLGSFRAEGALYSFVCLLKHPEELRVKGCFLHIAPFSRDGAGTGTIRYEEQEYLFQNLHDV